MEKEIPTEKITKNTKIPNQQEVWEKIAEKWNELKTIPGPAVEKFMQDKTGNILDLGCGSGRNFLKNKGTIYGLDFSKKMLEHAKTKSEKENIKAELFFMEKEKIPFNDNFFDYSICIAVLHCLTKKEQIRLMKELYRVMKPQSKSFISVWGRNSVKLRDKPKECFVPWTIKREEHISKEQRYTYIYEKEEFEQQVKEAGFKILKSWEERNLNIIAEK